jgi:ABC-2 type transport system permease protein
VTALTQTWTSRADSFVEELAKLPAFVRRDFLVAWSYRLSFVSEWLALLLQVLVFYFVGQLVDPARLPTYGGSHATYMEFVAVGIVLGTFMHLALGRIAQAVRNEQMIGTIESLLMTPTAPATIQLGVVVYDLLSIPLRTGVFLALITAAFGLQFHASGVVAAALVLVAFIPFVWGLGIASAGAILTFRRGSGFTMFGVSLLTIFSGAYFPLDLLPRWASAIARWNPIAVAVEGMREPLLGGRGWARTGIDLLVLSPVSLLVLAGGLAVFRRAMRRERRRGSLGLY